MVHGFQEEIIKSSINTYTGYFQINRKGFFDNESLAAFIEKPDAIIQEISSIPHIKAVTTRILSLGLVGGGNNSSGCLIVGIHPDREAQVTTFRNGVIKGRFLEPAEQNAIIIGVDMAQRLDLPLQGEATLLLLSSTGTIEAVNLQVVGIFDSGNPAFNRNMVMVSQSLLSQLVGYGNTKVSQIVVAIDHNRHLEETAQAISEKLRKFQAFYTDIDSSTKIPIDMIQEFGDVYVKMEKGIEFEKKLELLSWKEILPALVDVVQLQNIVLKIILTAVFLAAFIIVLNVTIMGVMERKREFGILKAMGMRSSQLAKLIFMESLMMTGAAFVIGTTLGTGISLLISYFPIAISSDLPLFKLGLIEPLIKPFVTIKSLLQPAIAVCLIAILAPLWPIWEISKLTPTETIRSV